MGPGQYLDEKTLALLKRARVVGVLDAWRRKDPTERRVEVAPGGDLFGPVGCCLVDPANLDRSTTYFGHDEDAARAAAAKAIEAGEV